MYALNSKMPRVYTGNEYSYFWTSNYISPCDDYIDISKNDTIILFDILLNHFFL